MKALHFLYLPLKVLNKITKGANVSKLIWCLDLKLPCFSTFTFVLGSSSSDNCLPSDSGECNVV